MAEYEIKLTGEHLASLMSNDQGFRKLLQDVINQVLEAQMTDHLHAEPYERTDGRQGHRNGYRVRQLSTRVGPLLLRIPQSRDGSFSTDIFRRYQRSEQAFVLGLMEMYLRGVSTRKVSAITEELCGTSFSKSTVSQLATELDLRVEAWGKRDLSGQEYPFLIVDALVLKVRRERAVRSTSALIVTGVNAEGNREILGLHLGDSESETTWEDIFISLKQRGLRGVDFAVSDQHKGLVKALRRHFQGACWQRCQVHFMRNILGHTPKSVQGEMVRGLRRILHASDQTEARKMFHHLQQSLDGKADKALPLLEEGLEDAIAVLTLPEKYHRRLRTTNMVERLNEEIRRREKVLRIFPNEESAFRLLGALLAEQHELWSTGRKYLNMDDYRQWRKLMHQEESKLLSVAK